MLIIRKIRDFISYIKLYPKYVHQVEIHQICVQDVDFWEMDGKRPGIFTTWCANNCRGKFRPIDNQTWGFTDPDDAAAFKLRWT